MKKFLTIAGVLAFVAILAGTGCSIATSLCPQIAVGRFQKMLYQGQSPNSWEPISETVRGVQENGIYLVSNLKYGETYPNSFLDVSYPSMEDTLSSRPTLIYFHGGGYFGGSKGYGDPLTGGGGNGKVLVALVKEGFNLVNVDYALVPDYHFPVPVLQMNQAINYCIRHAQELHLDMEHVVVMGGSAGAIMTAQYGAILSNPEYKALYPFEEQPLLPLSALQAVVVDDAPIDIPLFDNRSIKILIGNYLDNNVFFTDKQKAHWYNAINYLNASFPPAFMTAGTEDGFPKDMAHMSEVLTGLGVNNDNFVTPEDKYGLTKHGYLQDLGTVAAKDCYAAMMRFLRKHVSLK